MEGENPSNALAKDAWALEAYSLGVGNLFGGDSSSDDEDASHAGEGSDGGDGGGFAQQYRLRTLPFPGGHSVTVREFTYHRWNANMTWPGNEKFADWLHSGAGKERLCGRRVLEVGSATGALAIWLHKHEGCNIVTCDADDADIAENIVHNCRLNGVDPPLRHIPHTWGTQLPPGAADEFDVIIASDILLYTHSYAALIYTCRQLLSSPVRMTGNSSSPASEAERRHFIISWRRRMEDRLLFFNMARDAGFVVDEPIQGLLFDMYLPAST